MRCAERPFSDLLVESEESVPAGFEMRFQQLERNVAFILRMHPSFDLKHRHSAG